MEQSFINQCKENYFKKITPSDKESLGKEEYLFLLEIAQKEIEKDGLKRFSYYLVEYQYLVNLWASHYIIFQNPDEELKKKCLETIVRYAQSDNKKISKEEQNWLYENGYDDIMK